MNGMVAFSLFNHLEPNWTRTVAVVLIIAWVTICSQMVQISHILLISHDEAHRRPHPPRHHPDAMNSVKGIFSRKFLVLPVDSHSSVMETLRDTIIPCSFSNSRPCPFKN